MFSSLKNYVELWPGFGQVSDWAWFGAVPLNQSNRKIWIRVHITPFETRPLSLGSNAPDELQGVFTFNVFGPKGAGYDTIITLADSLSAYLRRARLGVAPHLLILKEGTVRTVSGATEDDGRRLVQRYLQVNLGIEYRLINI